MNADPQLRERLEGAARFVSPDLERRLERVHGAVDRRQRGRRLRTLAVAAAVGLLAVLLVARLPFGAAPTPPGSGRPVGTLVCLDLSSDVRRLVSLDLATGDARALTDGDASVLAAAPSPDGASLAWAVEDRGRFRVLLGAADGSDVVAIAETEATGAVGPDITDVAWSPDGSRIAYAGRVVEGGVARRTILVVHADGTGAPTAFDGLWTSVDWSPDGSRLLLLGFPGDEARFDLYTAAPDGTDLVRITDDQVANHEPSWSPDGSRIAFASGPSTFQDVFVMNADGSDPRRLTDWEGVDLFPVWSPDGGWVAFGSDRGATAAQQEANRSGNQMFEGLAPYVMRPDGSEVRAAPASDCALPLAWTRS